VIVGATHAISFFPSFGYKEVTLKQNGKKYNKVTIIQNQKHVYFLVELMPILYQYRVQLDEEMLHLKFCFGSSGVI
jgi:hypothetical protein